MFTLTTEYALRALVTMSQLPEHSVVKAKTLSSDCRIPAQYLSKVMLTLRNAGFVEGLRGSTGGYRLARSAAQIPIIEVVRQFEKVDDPRCLLGEGHECSEERACGAHARFRSVHLAYLDFLRTTTIAAIGERELEPMPE